MKLFDCRVLVCILVLLVHIHEHVWAVAPPSSYFYIAPSCTSDKGMSYKVDNHVSVDVLFINRSENLSEMLCPFVFDVNGSHRFNSHMCFGPNTTFTCTLKMTNITITGWGALIEGNRHSKQVLTFQDSTFLGGHEPQYRPDASQEMLKGMAIALQKFRPINSKIPERPIVIPTRFRWDDCFNHLSFQSMPIIGLVYEFHHDLFYSSYWHASRFTAALLLLMGVKRKQIVIEDNIFAKEVILPWVPFWNPLQTASIRGITRRISLLATRALLAMNFTKPSFIKNIELLNYQLTPISLSSALEIPERFVVHFQRSRLGKRYVENELEILGTLQEHLRPGFRIMVLPPTKEYKNIDSLHRVWQQYARIVNRAVVLMGAHGGGLNNMMWAPEDCHMIEFNEFPDDAHFLQSHGGIPVRKVFLNGFWARSGRDNRYYNIAAMTKDAMNFYEGPLSINVSEVLQIFRQLPINILF